MFGSEYERLSKGNRDPEIERETAEMTTNHPAILWNWM